jgi:Predicted enzyme related to lactoylglutathione lyase
MHAPAMNAHSKIDAAIDALDPTMALMALIQITGDRGLLNHYWDAIDGRQEELIETFVDIHAHEERPTIDPSVASEIRERLRLAVKAEKPAVMPQLDRPMFRMADQIAPASNHGMSYIFAKTFVHDLEAMAKFYEAVLGVVPSNRHKDRMLGREIDEITYRPSYAGGPALTLVKYLDSTGPSANEAVQGFLSQDLEATVERALAAGGSVPEPIREMPDFGIRVVFILDPEGHVNEVVQMLS